MISSAYFLTSCFDSLADFRTEIFMFVSLEFSNLFLMSSKNSDVKPFFPSWSWDWDVIVVKRIISI